MDSLKLIFGGFSSFAFSGSRACPAASLAVAEVLPSLPPGACVYVGCAKGVDAVVRAAIGGAVVFSASGGASFLAQRTVSVVRAAGACGLLVALPSGVCAVAVKPSRPFPGAGQGSWGAVAVAVSLGQAVLVCAESFPPWLVSQGFAPAMGWWFRPAPPGQGSLF